MPAIRRGEVWWVAFDRSRGGEIRKTRPAVVLSHHTANSALNRVVVIPVSSQTAKLYPGEAAVPPARGPAKATDDQIATAPDGRLRQHPSHLSANEISA